MDAKSIALLEFPAIRARLADHTSFPPGRRLAEALEPSSDPVIVRPRPGRDRRGPGAARRATRGRRSASAHDIGPWIERAARGGRLDPDALPGPGRDARRAEPPGRAPWPRNAGRCCASSARSSIRCRPCAAPWPAASTRSASCSTTASPRLGGLRQAVRIAYDRLRRRLDALVQSETASGALQEPIVTLRNGRYVLPVRADARSRVKGIVHDASGSGQTLFVEPLVAVELGNAWREAQVAERAEVERILDELSALVGAQAGRAARDPRARWPASTCGRPRRAWRPRWTRVRPETVERARRGPASAPRHPRPDRAGRPDRHPPRRRLRRAA